jgi:hypothetical protein
MALHSQAKEIVTILTTIGVGVFGSLGSISCWFFVGMGICGLTQLIVYCFVSSIEEEFYKKNVTEPADKMAKIDRRLEYKKKKTFYSGELRKLEKKAEKNKDIEGLSNADLYFRIHKDLNLTNIRRKRRK